MWDKNNEYSHDKSLSDIWFIVIFCFFLSCISICLLALWSERIYRTLSNQKWNKHCGLSVQKPTSIFLSMASRNFRNIFEEREREKERRDHSRSYVRSFTNGHGKWRNRRPLLYIKLYEVKRVTAILSRFVCCHVAGKWWISHKRIRISLNL